MAVQQKNRHIIDDFSNLAVKSLTLRLRFRWFYCGFGSRNCQSPNLSCGAQGVERAGDDLCCSNPMPIVLGFRFEQLCVRQDDSELVVEAMEERPQFRRFIHGSLRLELVDAQRPPHQA